MNLASVMNTNLSLRQRCVVGLCGFICLDVFDLVSAHSASQHNLPKGSCSMASQTTRNLQAVGLSGVILTVAKPAHLHPWARGHGRLTEIAIEQFFSSLRQQSSNSQLSCRAYWQASARQALRTKQTLTKIKLPQDADEPALDDAALLGVFLGAWWVLVSQSLPLIIAMRGYTLIRHTPGITEG